MGLNYVVTSAGGAEGAGGAGGEGGEEQGFAPPEVLFPLSVQTKFPARGIKLKKMSLS